VDVREQVEHWRRGAEADWRVGAHLVRVRKLRHGLFFVHLALEKMLKAHVCSQTRRYAPRIHALPRLAQLSGLGLATEHLQFLERFDRFSIAGRYPEDQLIPMPRPAESRRLMASAREVYRCLKRKLPDL
jgi:HEPN domain-containing protein